MNKKCQVFTPRDYVEILLDSVGYKKNLQGKRVLENSCGDGNILTAIVQRYIDDCINQGVAKTRIKYGLETDIYGIEIDPEQYAKCIDNLNSIAQTNGIGPVSWNILNEDYLKMNYEIEFDYIVGNPPYITYKELSTEEQEYLKKKFVSCKKGKFDYCYAFLEKSIESLSSNGKMAYLIPSSIYKTVFGKKIRSIMLPVTQTIIDYTNEKLFQNALVKSSIIVIDKIIDDKNIVLVDGTTNNKQLISRDSLGDKWCFVQDNVGKKRFGDYFRVSHSVATLCNKAYIIKNWAEDNKGHIICGDYKLESTVIRDAMSPKNRQSDKNEKIIFPYSYSNQHQLIKYSESDFSELYPETYRYLKQYKDELEKRDSDKNALWFQYGRSQALSNLDCEKALISTIISNKVLVYKLSQSAIPYSGMYIIPISSEMNIDEGIAILQRKKFLDYVRSIGIPINGNSVRVTSNDIEDYLFEEDSLHD